VYGDFSRFDGATLRDYDGVWFQQGRIQLDADHNQQAAIVRDWLRTLTLDLVGPFGGRGDHAGFAVALDAQGDLTISPGEYYVFGARCALRRASGNGSIGYDRWPARQLPEPPFLVYLQTWEETVNAVSDPRLLEPALGPNPPDTTVRTRTAWRTRIDPDVAWISSPATAGMSGREWVNEVHDRWSHPADRPRLRARVSEPGRPDASVVSLKAGYRGVENQLYRVEIHRPSGAAGSGGVTFKWSRDNGSVMFGIESAVRAAVDDDTTVLTLTSLGRDARSTLAPGDWVEVVDRSWVPFGEPGDLLAVQRVDPARREVTVTGDVRVDTSAPRPSDPPRPVLRRWDQPVDGGNGGIPIAPKPAGNATDEGWIDLEDGVQVHFPPGEGRYQRGDYWLIPARTATGSVLWPTGSAGPAAVEPNGPHRRYAPLALVTKEGVTDLRTLFVPLAFPDVDAALPALAPALPGAATTPPPVPRDDDRDDGDNG
jgi:hypothetical protein